MRSCLDGLTNASFSAALQYFASLQCLLQEPWPAQANISNGTYFDFIVVGGGTAGSTVAARLSELSLNILLLEAGGDPPQESIIPGLRHTLKRSRYDWNFTTVNDYHSSQALRGGRQSQPRGKMLGGSGSMNDMIYSRGFPVDYEEWASIVGDEWRWKNVLKHFKKSERLTDERITSDPELTHFHGFDGEIEVTGLNESTLASDKIIEAFQEIGFKRVKDMTNPHSIGVGRFSHTITGGKRASSATSLLNKAAINNNLYVLKDALVTKILIEDNIAYGIIVLLGNEELTFFTNKEIIISAGTFNTAKLLLISGIGPKKHLDKIGVKTIVDLPVGMNLHDHTMVLTYFAAENGTCEYKKEDFYMDTIQYLYNRRGALTSTTDVGAYISFNESAKNVPDFAFYTTCMPRQSNFYEPCLKFLGYTIDVCQKIDFANRDNEIFIIAVVNLKPVSRGKVQLKSSNPMESPLIYSGTFSDETDLKYYPRAMRIAWSLVNTKYFRNKKARVLHFDLDDCEALSDDKYLQCLAKSVAMSAWHAVGTAAMGSVVDEKLTVKGVNKLRIADASVIPKIIRGNTNAPVVMIAEKLADIIKRDISL